MVRRSAEGRGGCGGAEQSDVHESPCWHGRRPRPGRLRCRTKPIHVMATLQNDFATELHIDSVKLVADGAGFVAEEEREDLDPTDVVPHGAAGGHGKEVGTVTVRGVTLTLAGGCTEEHTFLLRCTTRTTCASGASVQPRRTTQDAPQGMRSRRALGCDQAEGRGGCWRYEPQSLCEQVDRDLRGGCTAVGRGVLRRAEPARRPRHVRRRVAADPARAGERARVAGGQLCACGV